MDAIVIFAAVIDGAVKIWANTVTLEQLCTHKASAKQVKQWNKLD